MKNDPGPDDMEVFRANAESMYKSAVAKGELEDLRGAIEYHLGHDDEFLEREFDSSLAELVQSEAYRPEWALKRILGFIHRTLWPTAQPIDHPPDDIEMIDIPLEEWRRQRAATKTTPGQARGYYLKRAL